MSLPRGIIFARLTIVREGEMVCEHAIPVGKNCRRCWEICREAGHFGTWHTKDQVCAVNVKEYHRLIPPLTTTK